MVAMKSKIAFVVLFAVILPAQAVQKCTDSEGRITYADFCPVSEPSKVENLYIQDTYDPYADHLAQENIRGMVESTSQSEYDRAQRNARISQANTIPDYSANSKAPRELRSGTDFDEQFSAALKSKLALQKAKADSLNRQRD